MKKNNKKKKATEPHRILILNTSNLDTSKLRGGRPPDWSLIFNRDPLDGITEEIWKSTIPVFDSKTKGQIIVFGTGGAIDEDEYFKKLWDANQNKR